MSAAKKKPQAGDAARGSRSAIDWRRHYTTARRTPAYAKSFRAGRNGHAVICCGWPPATPPSPHVLVLPPDSRPSGIDWSLLRDAFVFVCPPPGCRVDVGLLREIGRELAAAGARAVALFDGRHVLADWFRAADDRPEVRNDG